MPRGGRTWRETAPSVLVLAVMALVFAVWGAVARHVGLLDLVAPASFMAGLWSGIGLAWWRDARARDELDWIEGRRALQPPPVDENFGGWRHR